VLERFAAMDIMRIQRLLAVGFAFLGAVLVVLAAFVPLVVAELPVKSGDRLSVTITGWGLNATETDGFGDVPSNGNPLVIGAVLLLLAAVLSAVRKPNVLVAAVAAAFVAGTTWTVIEQVANWTSQFRVPDATSSYGTGLLLLLVGAVLAVCAAFLTARAARQPVSAIPDAV
jgi:hypothetical protein